MSRKNRTARRSRMALGLSTSAGASLAAAFISMGVAGAVPAGDGPPDPFTDLGVPGGPSLDVFLNSAEPVQAAQWDGYADNIVTTDHDAFADLFGSGGAGLDTANQTFSAQLDPFFDELTEGAHVNDHDAFVDLFGPSGASLDTAFPGLSSALDPAYDAIKLADADPFTELFGATGGAPIDSFLDAIPFGTTNLGAFLDPFADALVNAGFGA